MEDNNREYWEQYWISMLKEKKADVTYESYLEEYKCSLLKLKNKKALDLGCGSGRDTKWLIENDFDVTACDISEEVLKKLKKDGLDAKIMDLDLKEKLPFDDNSFGLINANLSFHYFNFENTVKIFNEAKRILTKDGILIGRVNSIKNKEDSDKFGQQTEENYYCGKGNSLGENFRLFDYKQFQTFCKYFDVLLLEELEIKREGKTKYIWLFILKKE